MPVQRIDIATKIQALTLMAAGHSQSKVAEEMSISLSSVKVWKKHALAQGWTGQPYDHLKLDYLTGEGGSTENSPQTPAGKKSGAKGKKRVMNEDDEAEENGTPEKVKAKKAKKEEGASMKEEDQNETVCS